MHLSAAFDVVWRDLRHAVRTLANSPAFAATAVIMLALGMGANTAVFSVIRAVLLKPLEFQDANALVFLSVDNPKGNPRLNDRFSIAEFEQMRNGIRSLAAIGAYGSNPENLSLSDGAHEAEALKGARISANLLGVLGVRPLLGRTFREAEDRPGGPDVAMISAELWKRRFGANPAVTVLNSS